MNEQPKIAELQLTAKQILEDEEITMRVVQSALIVFALNRQHYKSQKIIIEVVSDEVIE